MIIENQKDIITKTLVNDSKNLKESIEIKEGLKIPMEILNNFYFKYGFYYKNNKDDVLDTYKWTNKFTGTYDFDKTLNKYIITGDKFAMFKIENFHKTSLFADIFVGFEGTGIETFQIEMISKNKVLDDFHPIKKSLFQKEDGRVFFESRFQNDDIDPDDFWIKFFVTNKTSKIAILYYGIEELAPTNFFEIK